MRRLLPCLAIVLLGFAPAPFPRPDTSNLDLEKMQGEWVLVQMIVAGQSRDSGGGYFTIEIAGSRMQELSGGTVIWDYSIKLDGRKRPRSLDCIGRGIDRGWSDDRIYSLKENTLTINRGDVRPTDFDASRLGRVLRTYKRKSISRAETPRSCQPSSGGP